MNVNTIALSVKRGSKLAFQVAKEKSPTILCGIAIGGVIATVVTTVKQTKKAVRKYDAMTEIVVDEQTGEETVKEPDKKDLVIEMAKIYAPVAVLGSLTIASMVSSHVISLKRNAALAAMLTMAEESLREAEKHFDPEELKKFKDERVEKRLEECPFDPDNLVLTDTGDEIWFEPICGRYIRTSILHIRDCIAEYNENLAFGECMSYNELMAMIGFQENEVGDLIGWQGRRITVTYSSRNLSDGRPCGVISFDQEPSFNYREY